ncbi:hypothetical protein GQ55_3G237900 [Panicum hallii var. hallii]|uniref:Uncharacterized protein n=1 Tax=Panicum hallii var. hallii TaxID=1504633 RepID=A0A2T7ECP8_9POAL|nr:hypothetical protein GQ55_3G237900 [Panicum hallii var. hallii]
MCVEGRPLEKLELLREGGRGAACARLRLVAAARTRRTRDKRVRSRIERVERRWEGNPDLASWDGECCS